MDWEEFEEKLRASDNFVRLTPEQQEEMLEWCRTRPDEVKAAMIEKPMWNYYRIRDSGPAAGTLYCYSEEESGEITATINLYLNTVFPRRVFGVPLQDLIEVSPKSF